MSKDAIAEAHRLMDVIQREWDAIERAYRAHEKGDPEDVYRLLPNLKGRPRDYRDAYLTGALHAVLGIDVHLPRLIDALEHARAAR